MKMRVCVPLPCPSSFLIIISSSSSAAGRKDTAWQRLRQHSVPESCFTLEPWRHNFFFLSVRIYSIFVFKRLPQPSIKGRARTVNRLLTQCAELTWWAALLPFPSPSSPCGCLRPSGWVGPWEPLRLVMGQGSFRYSDSTCKMQDTSSGTAMPSASRICHLNPCHDTNESHKGIQINVFVFTSAVS